ncbi:MAG: hypothetical protein HY902_01070 [Deltaproteobacteria bacterium]|nr:hypothetical protein [Deltaproteobacteria bacterium]
MKHCVGLAVVFLGPPLIYLVWVRVAAWLKRWQPPRPGPPPQTGDR